MSLPEASPPPARTERPSAPPTPPIPEVPVDLDVEPCLPIRRIGPYRVIRELGRGAMGVVYMARDTSVGRTVALKVLSPQVALSDRARARFRREAHAVAQLDHESIVPIYAFGEERGWSFFSMKLIEGRTLSELIDEEVPAPDRVARWFVQIARALAYAHERGIIHRDVKPANIMITPEDRALVMDFGLAKDLGEATLTASGDVVGTPCFMAPEQARGLALDGRCDVYALGTALYEALTLTLPFKGKTGREVLVKVVKRAPRPPREIVPDLPVDLQTITLKAMQKDPRHRYATAAEMAEDLERWLRGEPIRARPVGRLERARRWVVRNRRRLAPVAAVTAVALLALGLQHRWGVEAQRASVARAASEARAGALGDRLAAVHRALGTPGVDGAVLARDLLEAIARDAPIDPQVADARTVVERRCAREETAAREASRRALERSESDRARLAELSSDPDDLAARIEAHEAAAKAALADLLRIRPHDADAARLRAALAGRRSRVVLRLPDPAARVSVRAFDRDYLEDGDFLAVDGPTVAALDLPLHGVLRVEREGFLELRLPYDLRGQADRPVVALVVPALVPEDDRTRGMVHVPAGAFVHGGNALGSALTTPTPVRVDGFLIDRTEVTRARFAEFVAAGGYDDPSYWTPEGWDYRNERELRGPAPVLRNDGPGALDRPVVGISRHEAEAFASWAGKRLPTEHEWEKAARGIDGRVYPWGNRFDPGRVHAGDVRGGSAPVGVTAGDRSPYGMLDASGNVAEWTASAPLARDGRTDRERAIIKGGSWAHDVKAGRGQCAARQALPVGDRQPFVGFRCVRDLPAR